MVLVLSIILQIRVWNSKNFTEEENIIELKYEAQQQALKKDKGSVLREER